VQTVASRHTPRTLHRLSSAMLGPAAGPLLLGPSAGPLTTQAHVHGTHTRPRDESFTHMAQAEGLLTLTLTLTRRKACSHALRSAADTAGRTAAARLEIGSSGVRAVYERQPPAAAAACAGPRSAADG